jgi:hypothetical protein
LAKNFYKPLIARVSEANPGFRPNASHHLAYQIHDELVLSGLLLDLSGMERGAFYVNAFSQALYVPKNYLTLNWGKRLERSRRWKIDADNELEITRQVLESVRMEGCPFLESLNSSRKLAEMLEAQRGTRGEININMWVDRAYSWVLEGDEAKAKRDLLYITREYVPEYDWVRELQEQCEVVLKSLDTGLEPTKELLNTWARQTRTHLGLLPPD